MLSMPSAATPAQNSPRRARRGLGAVAALIAAAAAFAPGSARAETGTPLPQGYTSDIDAPTAKPAVPVQKVDYDDEDPADEYADTDPSALTDFREPLSPYGAWVTDATYGTVWVPNATVVGADFAPYQTSGHWAMTDDDEWLWVSDYDWGYIPFHYGRWVWINGRGWSWIPGRVYSSAWVNWRVGDAGYIGWAPMPPAWYWADGIATNLWVTPYAAYCFVPTTYVFHEHVYNYVVRDAGTVRSVAAATRPYKPAHPTVKGATGSGGGGSHFRVASPSLSDAGLAAGPKSRVSPDMRSKAFATRSGTTAVRQAVASGHGFQAGSFPINSLPSHARDLRAGPNSFPASRDGRSDRSVLRAPSDAPSARSAPQFTYHPAPVERPAPPTRSAPQFTYNPTPTPRPSFSPPPSSGFRAPSGGFSAPSHPSSGFRAPSSGFSAPSSGFRAPSSGFSAPSHSSSGFRAPSVTHSSGGGGGGRHR